MLRPEVLAGQRLEVPRKGRWVPAVLRKLDDNGLPCASLGRISAWPEPCRSEKRFRIVDPYDEEHWPDESPRDCRELTRLGLGIRALTEREAQQPCDEKALFFVCAREFPGPAYEANIVRDDLVVSLAGQRPASLEEAAALVRGLEAGTETQVVVCQKGKRLETTIIPRSLPRVSEKAKASHLPRLSIGTE